MQQNRRQHLRKVPDESTFIQIERDEVGTVLNLSEGGLCFRSFAPVPEYGPVYFWLSFNLRDQVEAMGELAWADASRRIGGLRFTQLSKSGREQIHRWLSRLPAEEAEEEAPILQVAARGARREAKAGGPDRVARFVAKARPRRSILSLSLVGNEPEELKPSPVPARESESPAELVPLQRYLSVKRQQLVRGVLLGMCLSAAVGLSGFAYWRYHLRTGNAGAVPVQAPSPKVDLSVRPSASHVASPSNTPAGAIFSGDAPNRRAASDQVASRPMSDLYARTPSKVSETKALKASVPASDSSQVSGKTPLNRTPMTREQLWAAVQAGNTQAAVKLAELYIKGDGVSQNCQQARVLLLMASEKRNADAIKRLHELDKDPTTCP